MSGFTVSLARKLYFVQCGTVPSIMPGACVDKVKGVGKFELVGMVFFLYHFSIHFISANFSIDQLSGIFRTYIFIHDAL